MDKSLVSRDTEVMSGAPCFTGTRVPVNLFDYQNGKLLAIAATEFDAFITVDKNLPFQQNLATLPIAIGSDRS